MLKRIQLVMAKVESAYGTDPVPVKTTDAFRAYDVNVKPVGDLKTRKILSSSLSPQGHVIGGKKLEVTFKTEIKGSGAAGTAPDWGVLFRGCGMDEDIVASTSVAYTPLSSGHESITIYVHHNGLYYKVRGARGSFKINAKAGEFGEIEWKFIGLYTKPLDLACPTGETVDSTTPPRVVSAQFATDSYAAVIDAFMFDMACKIVTPPDMNQASGFGEITISERDPNGSFDPELVTIATEDFFGDWEDSASKAIGLQIGATSGNIATIDVDYASYRELSHGDREGIMTLDIPFTAKGGSSGDDEFAITFT